MVTSIRHGQSHRGMKNTNIILEKGESKRLSFSLGPFALFEVSYVYVTLIIFKNFYWG